MPTPGVSGLAVAMMGAGFTLSYSALKNATVPDTLRALLQGQPVVSSTAGSVSETRNAVLASLDTGAAGANAAGGSGGSAGGGSVPPAGDIGAAIVTRARLELGKPYKFGAAGPSSFDCSGFVNRVLSDLGQPIPGSSTGKFSGHGPVSGQYYVWGGAATIPRAQMAAGDLVCWIGHIALATGPDTIIHAASGAGKVNERKAYWTPAPLVRRIKPRTAPVQV